MDNEYESDMELNSPCNHCGSYDKSHSRVFCGQLHELVKRVRYGHEATGIETLRTILAEPETAKIIERLKQKGI